jgi:hypothetical protein
MSHEPNEPSKNDNEHVQQQLIHAALDSALEELDSDNDDDDEEENETFSDCISNEHEIHHIIQPKDVHHERPSNVNSTATTASQPILGPPKPPPQTPLDDTNAQMDQLFASMMGQLMNMNDDNDGDNNNTNRTPLDPLVADVLSNMNEDEVLGRFMQEIQSRLQSELTSAALSTSASTSNHSNKSKQMNRPTTTAPAKSSTAPRSVSSTTTPPPSQPTTESNNHNNNSNEVESVISNLVSNLSQTMNRSLHDDDDDDDISELDDLPDMDQMDDNHNNDEDDMAVLLQKLMGNLMNHNNSSNNNNNNTTNNADHNDTTTTSADSILDGMMEQLLCKDIMYEPMKQVASKFPHWLQEQKQKSTLSATEYTRYEERIAGWNQITFLK